jgi:putative SOS response-associated peptidase YedK
MCGRFGSFAEEDDPEISSLIKEAGLFWLTVGDRLVKTKGEVFPTDIVPVILADGGANGVNLSAKAMYWGFPGYPDRARPKARPKPLINAKAETALSLRTWKDSTAGRRCVIPCGGFYEWSHGNPGHKIKYFFTARQGEASRALFLGGIFKEFKEDDGTNLLHFSIITVPANDSIMDIHDRMPLILRRPDFPDWLSKADRFMGLLQRNTVGLDRRVSV